MANFQEELIQKLNDKNLSEGSIKLYIRNLQKLNNGQLLSFKFLNKVDNILGKISKFKANTQRGILISIVSVLGCCPEDKKLIKLRNQYYKLMNEKNTEIKKEGKAAKVAPAPVIKETKKEVKPRRKVTKKKA